mgnify:CR=1 FL=1
MNRLKNSFNNIIYGICFKMTRTLMPFVIRSIIIYELGTEYAGLDSLFISILQVLSLAELGFGSAIVFSMYKPIAESNKSLVCALLNYYRKIYIVIGSIILGVGLSALPFLKYIIKNGYPDSINIYFLYIIYLLNTVSSYFLYAYSQSLLNALQRSDIVNKIQLIINITIYIFQIVVLLTTQNYYFYTILMLIGTILINVISNIVTVKKYNYYSCTGTLSTEDKKSIISNTKSLIGHKISGVILNSADNIVISCFLGLTAVTLYSNYFYVISGVAAILSVCFEAITASIGNSIVLENNEKNYHDFILFSDLSDWIIGVCCVCLVGMYQTFMSIWVGKNLLLPTMTVFLFIVYFYFNIVRKMTLTYKDAIGMWWADFWKPYAGAASNIILNIILVRSIGLNGVILSSIFSMAFISLPWGAKVLHKFYFKKSLKVYYSKLLFHLMLTIIACAFTVIIEFHISSAGFKGLLLRGGLCIIIGNIVFGTGYAFSHELTTILQFAGKLFHI